MADFSNNTDLPIGLRNNNPGNIRTGSLWLGLVGSENGFCTFSETLYGLRAMALDLSNKINSEGLDTITAIITKYAPPSENDTQSYIDSVSSYTGWAADATIPYTKANLFLLMRAQINVEQGAQYAALITDDDINAGIAAIPDTLLSLLGNAITNNPTDTFFALAIAAGLFFLVRNTL